MKISQANVRKQIADKTRKIVDQQKSLTLAEFLAQGQKRSRQKRKPLANEMVEVK
jgi:hypothetical protein